MLEVTVLTALGPPNSPPTAGFLLANKIRMATKASTQKMVTEKPKFSCFFKADGGYSCTSACSIFVMTIEVRTDLRSLG